MNFSDIWESLTSPYVWDTSSFVRNQVVHPLAGSFFYNAARANNFSFWGGFAYTAVSSWVWENLFENSSTSINDLITTTTAGCVTGEVLHRLGYEVSRFWNPLMWLLSPVDAANYLIKNPDKAFKPNDEIESGIYFFEAGIGGSLFINPENLAELGGDMNSSLFLIYEEPFDHKTKEPFDQFTLDAQVYTDFSSCFAFAEFEGHLYSWPFFQNTNLPSSIGISMNYK
ncbi:MAG: DUF3943 domain-containing protein, partial [Treponemataceae bacterium]|nr:DUF3943 domain-containing protein [Treponemataceae bacterium]